jgi:putative ABC transport system ATP-binding protein
MLQVLCTSEKENLERAIHCHGLTKTFGQGNAQVKALQGTDLDVNFGELLMLVGPSGCGKTTLISIIAGILDPDAGECLLLGTDMQKMRADERTRFRGSSIGFVFHAFNLLLALTVAENVAAPLLISGMDRKAAVVQAGNVLDSLGLGERKDSPSALLILIPIKNSNNMLFVLRGMYGQTRHRNCIFG